jgi:hypothetical protein
MTRQAGGINSGTRHVLLQRWHLSISGLLKLPQFAHVTRVIFGWVSLYVMYAVKPKARVPSIQQSFAFSESPTVAASLLTRQASNIASIIDGNIINRAA